MGILQVVCRSLEWTSGVSGCVAASRTLGETIVAAGMRADTFQSGDNDRVKTADEATMQAANDQVSQLETRGAWPFETLRFRRLGDEVHILWESRRHRKRLASSAAEVDWRLGHRLINNLWPPAGLNWWIGLVFSLGASLFIIASVGTLQPDSSLFAPQLLNAIYFAGSIPFTTAAYLQLYQAANADAASSRRWIGWQPDNPGWLSCALQFIGTILFNVNTFDAFLPELTWWRQDLYIWIPNFLGSILFLASGYLAWIEVGHAHWSWSPRSLSWWIVLINLLGCIGFMISACLAVVLPYEPESNRLTWSVAFTLQGAVCFLLGALLMLPEAEQEKRTDN